MTDEADDPTGLRDRTTTGQDRVRMVARQLTEPRTANWIATEADWSHEPTTRILERLVEDGVLHKDEDGTHTTYYPDYRQQVLQEATRLRDSSRTVQDLTDRLESMTARIREWSEEFDVDSPNELRATIADAALDPDEASRRREIAREWDRLDGRIRIVEFAIREWDFLAPGEDHGVATN